MSDVIDPTALGDEDRAALQRLILTLADSKRLLGIRYSDWILGSPSVETGIATSSMTQDEWGHARLLYAMLKSLNTDPRAAEHDRATSEYASIAALDEEAPDWAALVAMMTLADRAITVMLESFSRGSLEQAASRVPKMLAEEEFHTSLGAAWYRRLAGTEGEAHELLVRATRSMLPTLIAWVGADDPPMRRMVEAGVVEAAGDRLAAFRDAVRDLAALVDVDVDTVEPSTDWDGARGRTAGQPSEESAARARGDLNRALLVD
jgi:1,2-phenylacetyl-CoA epoxidase catalytic subunit